jgi:hypothetical protein
MCISSAISCALSCASAVQFHVCCATVSLSPNFGKVLVRCLSWACKPRTQRERERHTHTHTYTQRERVVEKHLCVWGCWNSLASFQATESLGCCCCSRCWVREFGVESTSMHASIHGGDRLPPLLGLRIRRFRRLLGSVENPSPSLLFSKYDLWWCCCREEEHLGTSRNISNLHKPFGFVLQTIGEVFCWWIFERQ